MKTHSVSAIILLTCCFVAAVPVVRAEEAKRSNVLFIAIDDLRPTLGCYGDPVAATPNIDRLANRGTLFHRAYCQQAVCSPSRLSLMTGRRPDTIRVWDLRAHFREAIPDVVTLPQHFKNHGYHTQSLGKPFFLAVGFRKPHLPFCAPQKYWDLYDCAQIPLSVEDKHPQDAPELATRSWKELEGYTDVPDDGQLSADKIRELRHGYYACVSYVDALVGRLLDELEKLKLAENTVVVLWGDHGYHLGEQGLWTKANNYELSTRVPLLVAVPGQARTGVKSNALVEFV